MGCRQVLMYVNARLCARIVLGTSRETWATKAS